MGKQVDVVDLEKKSVRGRLTAAFPDTIEHTAFSADLARMACRRGFDPVIVDISRLPRPQE